MIYSIFHVLDKLQSHILKLIQEFNFSQGAASVEALKTDEDSSSLTPIGQALRHVQPNEYESIFSSDKSLIKVHSYGGDILQYADHVNKLATAVMTDDDFDHDTLLRKRSNPYVRNLFISTDGEAIDPIEGAIALRKASIRLGDGLALRSMHPDLGVNTFHNCQTAIKILKDLDGFFKESSFGYYDYRTQESGTVYFWET